LDHNGESKRLPTMTVSEIGPSRHLLRCICMSEVERILLQKSVAGSCDQ
jgi:hypothetical protein